MFLSFPQHPFPHLIPSPVKTTCLSLLTLLIPIFRRSPITQISSNFLFPNSFFYTRPLFQHAFPGNPPANPFREVYRPKKQIDIFQIYTLLFLLKTQTPSLKPSFVADSQLCLSTNAAKEEMIEEKLQNGDVNHIQKL